MIASTEYHNFLTESKLEKKRELFPISSKNLTAPFNLDTFYTLSKVRYEQVWALA